MLIGVAASCSTDKVASIVAEHNDSSMKRTVNLYSAYQLANGWQGPKDEAVLRRFVIDGGLPNKNLQYMGIDPNKLDGLFISDRDKKPFKIRWGVMGGRGVIDAIVFEDEGVNGKKLVAFNGATVEEEDDARYKDLWQHGGMPMGAKSAAPATGGPSENK
jgi:hypothetical protein